jgi:hypothetical protein
VLTNDAAASTETRAFDWRSKVETRSQGVSGCKTFGSDRLKPLSSGLRRVAHGMGFGREVEQGLGGADNDRELRQVYDPAELIPRWIMLSRSGP